MAYDNKQREFCKGLYFSETDLTKNIETNEKQFIFFKVSIRKKELIEYLESQNSDDDWINVDIKRSKTQKFYGEVNTYKREDNSIDQNRSGDNRPTSSSKYLKDFEAKKKREQKEQWETQKEQQFDEPPF